MDAVERALAALRTDRLDVLLTHSLDALMDPDALVQVFDDPKTGGKVLHVGVFDHPPSQLAPACAPRAADHRSGCRRCACSH